MDERPRLHAILTVTGASGALDGEGMNRLLGVEGVFRAGGERMAIGQLRPDSWRLEVAEVGTDWPGLLDRVLEPMRRNGEEFLERCRASGLEAQVLMVAYMTSLSPDGSFSAEHVSDLARFGCSLDIDLYCDPERAEI